MPTHNFPYNRPHVTKQELKKAYRAAQIVEGVGRSYWLEHDGSSPMAFLRQEVPAIAGKSDTIHFFTVLSQPDEEYNWREVSSYALAMYRQYKSSMYWDVRDKAEAIFRLCIQRKYHRYGYLP